MATAAEMFTTCHYCDLRAATKRRVIVRKPEGRPRIRDIYACPVHEQLAEREARAARGA